jgi:crossover junction endodeoxyribonuclease RusA
MKTRLILSLPPSVNHMYVNGYMGRKLSRILTISAKKWMQEAVLKTNVWRNQHGWETCQDKTIVRVWYYFPDLRRRDTHNTLKILLDALQAGQIYVDDKYALPHVMDYIVDKNHPRIEIEFEVK